jgi:oligopeptide transport system substrate-binding protein
MGNQAVVRMLFVGLARLDESLMPRLELAESCQISSDNKTYVFTLKECQWSDGSPITAHDFECTWKAALTPAYSSACTNLFFYLKNGRKVLLGQVPADQLGVKAVDDKTLVVELEWANPKFLDILINSVFSPVHRSMHTTPPDTAHLVCSGPFCLKDYAFQNQIVLTKNVHYWNSADVKLQELHYYIVKDPNTALMMFENREIDWLGDPLSKVVSDSIPALKARGVLRSTPMAGLQWMFVNTDKAPLNNVNIRKALAYAIDRQAIMKELLHLDEMTPTLGLIPKITKRERWHPWFVDNDVQKAQALFKKGLQELGLTVDQLPAFSIMYGTWASAKSVEAIQQMWKKNLGITVNIEQLDGPVLFNRWYKHDYHIAWLSWTLQYNDPVNMLEIFKYKYIQPNCSAWENSDFIQHANASLSTTSDQDRWQHMEAAEKIFFDEMPSIPVNDFTAFYLTQPYVKGVSVNHLYQVDFDRASVDTE